MGRPVKRSFTISGHRTSISLEAPFWDALKSAAAEERISVASLVGRIDSTRGSSGLSSAVRVWLLLQHRAGRERRAGS
jgi:predicted DNA-binding ribbon-helix-helix protein